MLVCQAESQARGRESYRKRQDGEVVRPVVRHRDVVEAGPSAALDVDPFEFFCLAELVSFELLVGCDRSCLRSGWALLGTSRGGLLPVAFMTPPRKMGM